MMRHFQDHYSSPVGWSRVSAPGRMRLADETTTPSEQSDRRGTRPDAGVIASAPMSDQTPRVPRTEMATRATRFKAQERAAFKLAQAGWTVTPPPEEKRGLPVPQTQ